MFRRQVEDVGVEELEHDHAGLLIAAAAEVRHHTEPVVILQFLSGNSFDYVEQRLGDQALELAEGLLLEDRAYVCLFLGGALPEDQFADFAEQGRGSSANSLFSSCFRWTFAKRASSPLGSFKNLSILS